MIETYGTYNPGSAGTLKGTVTSDGSVYDIYEVVRTDAPSIQGTATFNQYLSIRQTERTSGTITLANHFDAWAGLGMVSDPVLSCETRVVANVFVLVRISGLSIIRSWLQRVMRAVDLLLSQSLEYACHEYMSWSSFQMYRVQTIYHLNKYDSAMPVHTESFP